MRANKTTNKIVLMIIITTELPEAGIQELIIPSSKGKERTTNNIAPSKASLNQQVFNQMYFIGCWSIVIHG